MTNYIVISSHVRYHEPRARLLASFEWPDIIVTLNGSNRDETISENGVTYIHMLTNIYEYSAFYAPLHVGGQGDVYMLIHDTSIAGPNFAAKAAEAFAEFRRSGADILWCSSSGQCNICVFGRKVAQVARAMWGTRSRLDKGHAIVMEHCPECTDSLKSREDLHQKYVGQATREVSRHPVYSEYVRVGMHYPYLDIVKYFLFVESLENVRHPDIP